MDIKRQRLCEIEPTSVGSTGTAGRTSLPILRLTIPLRASNRIQLLEEFRSVVSELRARSPIRLSTAKVTDLMIDHLYSIEYSVSLNGTDPKQNYFVSPVSAKTIGKAISCDLDFSVVRLQQDTVTFVDAFVQLYRQRPIKYI